MGSGALVVLQTLDFVLPSTYILLQAKHLGHSAHSVVF